MEGDAVFRQEPDSPGIAGGPRLAVDNSGPGGSFFPAVGDGARRTATAVEQLEHLKRGLSDLDRKVTASYQDLDGRITASCVRVTSMEAELLPDGGDFRFQDCEDKSTALYQGLERKISALIRNAALRAQNSKAVRGDMELVPLYSVVTGQEMDGFPGNADEMDRLGDDDVNRLLRHLGEPATGTSTDKMRSLKLACRTECGALVELIASPSYPGERTGEIGRRGTTMAWNHGRRPQGPCRVFISDTRRRIRMRATPPCRRAGQVDGRGKALAPSTSATTDGQPKHGCVVAHMAAVEPSAVGDAMSRGSLVSPLSRRASRREIYGPWTAAFLRQNQRRLQSPAPGHSASFPYAPADASRPAGAAGHGGRPGGGSARRPTGLRGSSLASSPSTASRSRSSNSPSSSSTCASSPRAPSAACSGPPPPASPSMASPSPSSRCCSAAPSPTSGCAGTAALMQHRKSVTVVSVIRLRAFDFTSGTVNPTWDLFDLGVWSIVEVNVGIMGVCLPSLRLLVMQLWPRVRSSARKLSTGHTTNGQAASMTTAMAPAHDVSTPVAAPISIGDPPGRFSLPRYEVRVIAAKESGD